MGAEGLRIGAEENGGLSRTEFIPFAWLLGKSKRNKFRTTKLANAATLVVSVEKALNSDLDLNYSSYVFHPFVAFVSFCSNHLLPAVTQVQQDPGRTCQSCRNRRNTVPHVQQ